MRKVFVLVLAFMAFILFAQEVQQPVVKLDGNKITATFVIPEGMHQTLQEDYFYVNIDSISGITAGKIVYPEGPKNAEGYVDYHGTVTLTRELTISPDLDNSIKTIKAYAGFQYCYETGTCMAPEEFEYEIDITSISKKTQDKQVTNSNTLPTENSTNSLNILKYLLMAFIGGLILNIMPCVLPVLSIKAMSLVKQSQQSRKQIFQGAMAYTGGILASFVILAAIIVILKTSGEMVGWGFQFQSPGFVTALLIVIFVFSLSLFDVFVMSAPGMTTATKASNKKGLTGSFVSGIFAVLLATPCTAPLLGAALGFAFSQPPIMIFAIFILIGIGLAFPFILLGIWPKAIKAIPKPGEWMNIFKEVMGFLLLLTALYLIRSLYFLIGGEKLISVLLFLIILGFSTWMYGRFARPEYSKSKQWLFTILALVIAIVGGIFTLNYGDTTQQASAQESHIYGNWQKFSPELLQKYRDENKPVFVDFGAEWCLTCKTNEINVLFTEDIEKAFKDNGVQMLKGDNTKKDDIITEWLRKFDRAGVPLYIFYIPGQDEPEVMPEIITKDMVYNLLEKLKK